MTPKENVLACCLLVLGVLVLSACVSIDEYNREVESCNERIADAQTIIDETTAACNERIADAQTIIDETTADYNERIEDAQAIIDNNAEDAQAIIDNNAEKCNADVEKTVKECNKLLDSCSCDASIWTY